MYAFLLQSHAIIRWFVLLGLLVAIVQGIRGWAGGKQFSSADNTIRHISATIAQIQLMVGAAMYFNSPAIVYFFKNFREAVRQPQLAFFGLVHITLMTVAVVLITIGSATAKRETTDREKFRTMVIWYSIALAVIIIAIPWPFSPLAARPYFR